VTCTTVGTVGETDSPFHSNHSQKRQTTVQNLVIIKAQNSEQRGSKILRLLYLELGNNTYPRNPL